MHTKAVRGIRVAQILREEKHRKIIYCCRYIPSDVPSLICTLT